LRRINNPGISIIEDGDGIRRQKLHEGCFSLQREKLTNTTEEPPEGRKEPWRGEIFMVRVVLGNSLKKRDVRRVAIACYG